MDYIEAATKLGEAIAESSILQDWRNAEEAVLNDEKAQQLMEEYRQLQTEMVNGARSDMDKTNLENVKGLLLSKQQELNDYGVTGEYMRSRVSFEDMMKNINKILEYYVTGNDSSCGGSCSGCSGCDH